MTRLKLTTWQFAMLTAAVTSGIASVGFAQSTFGPGVSQGTINTSQINEASGLAASRNNANVLWVHNDSGDTNRVFAIDTTGRLLGTYSLPGATHRDWEAISVGPGPVAGVDYLYLMESNEGADPGRVYRVPEPVVYASQAVAPVSRSVAGVDSKKFTIPEADSESMFVDPRDGGVYLGSKESGRAQFYQGTQAQFATAGTTTLNTPAATIAGIISNANGADITPDGSQIMVRFNGQFALLYNRSATQTVSQALANPSPQFIPINGQDIEENAEAIAFDANGRDFFTISEGSNQTLYRYTRTSSDMPFVPTTLVAAGSEWKYLANGSNQGTNWRQAGFADSSWSVGAGQLGYGDGDETTTVGFGGNASNKHVTTYFRKTFTIADLAGITGLTLKLLQDDGAAVYLNGVEVARHNLIADASFDALASSVIPNALENTWFSMAIDPSLLVLGMNTLSIEIHQASLGDPDISFDAQLVTSAVPEPTAMGIAAIGGLFALRRRRA